MNRTAFAALAAACLLPCTLSAQTDWTRRSGLEGRFEFGFCYDLARQRAVAFGGALAGTNYTDDTWEWDGAQWHLQSPAARPLPRILPGMAYDSGRGVVVMFGGSTPTTSLGDTWEWDGTTWTRRVTATLPPASGAECLAYDSARQRTVSFNGSSTWEYDGSDWSRITTATVPPLRVGHRMVYDPVRGLVVLFGGYGAGFTCLSDTWEYDGLDWRQPALATAPPCRAWHAMAYDAIRQQIVLHGGRDGANALLGDTWTWNGTRWTPVGVATAPAPRQLHAMVFDWSRGVTLLFGGNRGGILFAGGESDLWSWDGARWQQLQPTFAAPRAGGAHAAAYDPSRDRLVHLHTDSGETWEWDGNAWLQMQPNFVPFPRTWAAMAYDPNRGRVVLFGGKASGSTTLLAETWEWDGVDWALLSPPSTPPATALHAMVTDRARQRVVLQGGLSHDETWEYDGVTWQRVLTPTAPPQDSSPSMAYDAARERTVLFGGTAGDETWEYDGSDWTRLVPAQAPSPRIGHAMAFDWLRARTVLFGGSDRNTAPRFLDDTWEWDGLVWAQRSPNGHPDARADMTLDYDRGRQELVLFGGNAGSPDPRRDTWVYRSDSPAAYEAFGTGCLGSGGTPALGATPFHAPWIGDRFAVELTQAASGSAWASLVAGHSRTTWAGQPLPRPLDPLGLLGCSLLVSIDGVSELRSVTAGASVSWSFPIPAQPVLVGLTFYQQALVLDPFASNGLGSVSNGAAGRIGVR